MGGYSIGGLFASVNLDASQYLATLDEIQAGSALLSVNVERAGNTVAGLSKELNKAGFNTAEFKSSLASLRAQGLSTAESLDVIGSSITRLQNRLVELRQSQPSISKQPFTEAQLEAEAAIHAEAQRVMASVNRAAVETELDVDAKRRQVEMFARDQAAIIERTRMEEQAAATRNAIDDGAAARRIGVLEAEVRAAEALYAQELAAMAGVQSARTGVDAKASANRTAILADELKEAELIFAAETEAAEAKAATRNRIETGASARRTEILAAELARAEAMFAEEAAASAAAARAAAATAGGGGAAAGGIGASIGAGIGKGGFSPHASLSSGALIGGGVALFGGYEAIKQAAEFEDAIAKVRAAIGNVSGEMAQKMGDSALELSKKVGIAAKDIVAEFATMSKAEMDTAEQFKNLPVLAEFAVATNTDLDKSAKLVLTVMNTLKIPFSELPKVTDQFTAANHLAIGSVDDFARALEGRAGAAFRAAKIPLNEALGMTIAFARGGVEANIAQTALTQTVLKLTNSVEKHGDVTIDVAGKQLKWHDIMYKTNGELNTMASVFQTLDKAFVGAPTEKVTQFFQAIGVSGQRDVYVKSLLGMGDAIETFSKQLANPGEERLKSFDAAMTSPIQQFKLLKETVRDAAIALGEQFLPATQLVAEGLKVSINGVGIYLDTLRAVYKVAKEIVTTSATERAEAANKAEAKAAADLYRKLSTTTAKTPGTGDFDDPQADARAEAKRQKEADRKYRILQLEITNEENAAKAQLKIDLLKEEEIAEVDEEAINKKKDRIERYNDEVLQITLAANAKRIAAEKGKTGENTDLAIVGNSQQAMSQNEQQRLELEAQASAKIRNMQLQDAKEEMRIRKQQDDEARRLDTQKLNDHVHALQLEIEADREHSTHILEMAKSRAAFEESMGLISKAERLKIDRETEADEFKLQSEAIDNEIKLLDDRQNRIGQKDEAIESKKQQLLNQRQKLEDQHAARNQTYDQQELQGLDRLEEATIRLVVEQRKLMELGDQSDRLITLKNLEIQTEALATKSRSLGGVYTDIADSFQNAMKSVGKTLAGALLDPANFTKNWKSALKSIETELLGTFLQSMLNLGAAELFSTLKVGAAKKAAAVTQLGLIKATAAAQIAADVEVATARAALFASERTTILASSELVALAQIAAEAAVGGAAAAASIAAIPVFGPGLAIEAGQGMQAAILSTFAPQLLTFEHGGDVVKDTVALVHGGEHVINADLSKALKSMVNGDGFGGGIAIDLRGSAFGAGLTEAMVDSYMQSAIGKIRRSGGLATSRGRF